MTDTDRCEPPPEWRGKDGWYWLNADAPVFWSAEEQEWVWTQGFAKPERAFQYGYRYVAPVTPPAVVAALVEALEGVMNAPLPPGKHTTTGGVVFVPLVEWAAVEAALALHRGEAGR